MKRKVTKKAESQGNETDESQDFAAPVAPLILRVHAAAHAAGISESTLRRAIQDGVVRGITRGGALCVERREILEIKGKLLKRIAPSIGIKEAQDGEEAADVFSRLDRCQSIGSIVQEMKITPQKVLALFDQWKKCAVATQTDLEVLHGKRELPKPPSLAAAFIPMAPAAPLAMPIVNTSDADRKPEDSAPSRGKSKAAEMVADARRREAEMAEAPPGT